MCTAYTYLIDGSVRNIMSNACNPCCVSSALVLVHLIMSRHTVAAYAFLTWDYRKI